MKPTQIKHDGDGKLYREEGERVIWITEVETHNGDKIAKAMNDLVKEAYMCGLKTSGNEDAGDNGYHGFDIIQPLDMGVGFTDSGAPFFYESKK